MHQSTVYVVDDDASLRSAIEDLLSSLGARVLTFGAAAEYVAYARSESPSCLLLDVNLPDINGLDLQRELGGDEHPPIVFISGYGDIPLTVRAMKAGAIDFLPKPFSEEQLLSAIRLALQKHRETLRQQGDVTELQERYMSLTPREREVFGLVIEGLRNKQAATELGISEITVQIHRSQVMRKMKAGTLAALVRMAIRLGVSTAEEPQRA